MTILETGLEFIGKYQVVITFGVAIVSSIVACIKVAANVCTTAMATPIEVTLMKRNEQYKFKVSNFVMIWFFISIIYIYTGAILLFSNPNLYPEKYTTSISSEDSAQDSDEEYVKENEKKEETIEENNNVVGEKEFQEQNDNLSNKENDNDSVNALVLLLGLFGFMGSGIVLVIVCAVKNIGIIIRWLNSLDECKKVKVKRAIIVCPLVVILVCLLSIVSNWAFWLLAIVFVLGIVSYFRSTQKGVEKTILELQFILCACLFVLILGANNLFVWRVEYYVSYSSIVWMSLVSTILALVMCFFGYWIISMKTNPGKAKVMYYNEDLDRKLYLHFKYSEDLLVAGEKEVIEGCEAYYLVKIDDIVNKKLQKLSSESDYYSKTYTENIILQSDGGREICLEKIMEKLCVLLQENQVSQSEYSNTKIYIKQNEGKVYFYLPNEKIERSKQNFSI